MKGSLAAAEVFSKVNAECLKLCNIASNSNFREAEFMLSVKEISGDEGMTVCRALLDGIEDSDDQELQNKITEGRCTICIKSTYEVDCDEDEHVIMCDGCNAEAHLKCLNMTVVPTYDWLCDKCNERMILREGKGSNIVPGLKDIDRYRSKIDEEELILQILDQKLRNNNEVNTNYNCNDMRCLYCNLGESDICSPMVIGQSRLEHNAHIDLNQPTVADDIIKNKKGTLIKFFIFGEVVDKPPLDVPYYPLVDTGNIYIYAYDIWLWVFIQFTTAYSSPFP